MNNPHLIVGENNRCLCGHYGKQGRIYCDDVLQALKQVEAYTDAQENPSLHYPKGGRGPCVPTPEQLRLLLTVLEPLVKDTGQRALAFIATIGRKEGV